MKHLNFELINKAIHTLQGHYEIKTEKLSSELRELAETVTPKTLDTADFFVLLSTADSHQTAEAQAVQVALRQALGYPSEDPAGIRLSFSTLHLADGGVLAKTRLVPDNVDKTKPPIVFAGGIFHKTSVYLDFLAKLATESGREILAFDSPGVGSSRITSKSIHYQQLADSLPQVIASEYPPEHAVVVMGHSLGSIAIRNLYLHPEGLANPIERFVMIAPLPAVKEQQNGLKFSMPYMLSGTLSMVKRFGRLAPEKGDGHFYFDKHDSEDRKWIEKTIADERMPADPFHYLDVLGQVDKNPVIDDMHDFRLKVVLFSDDEIMKCVKPEWWIQKGALIIGDQDHSAIAGREVSDTVVKAIADLLPANE
jgi:pimeloyl-ACP methyl ester carboxylesterase